MKLYQVNKKPIVRISFGANKSLSFEDTTTEEVFNLFIKVFENHKVNRTIELKDFSPLKKPSASLNLCVTVRAELGKKFDKSKSKTIYGLNDTEAMEVFKNNYTLYC